MPDKNKLDMREPQIIEKDGLVKFLSDVHGNKFCADDYKDGFEMIIDYPSGVRVIDYKVYVDDFGRKSWKEVGRRQWVSDPEHPKISFCGKWKEGWDE